MWRQRGLDAAGSRLQVRGSGSTAPGCARIRDASQWRCRCWTDDDLVTLANVVGAKDQVQRLETVADANAMFDTTIKRRFLFKKPRPRGQVYQADFMKRK